MCIPGDGGVSSSRLTLSRFEVLEIRVEAIDGLRRDCSPLTLPASDPVTLC